MPDIALRERERDSDVFESTSRSRIELDWHLSLGKEFIKTDYQEHGITY